MSESEFEIEEKTLPPLLVGGIRMRGKYSDCGQGFARLCRHFGRHTCGRPMLLHYDLEFKENDADFEACIPVRKGASSGDIVVHELPGGLCVTLLHRGPYETLHASYRRLFAYLEENYFHPLVPLREIYLKGPGMFFRGNPKRYLTEIQVLLSK